MTNTDNITLTDSALNRVKEIRTKPENKNKFLRVGVSGGGCSGFQYLFNLDDKSNADDILILKEGDQVIALTDEISLPLLDGCKVDFVNELGASYFKVVNPNAKSSCGCGASFSI